MGLFKIMVVMERPEVTQEMVQMVREEALALVVRQVQLEQQLPQRLRGV